VTTAAPPKVKEKRPKAQPKQLSYAGHFRGFDVRRWATAIRLGEENPLASNLLLCRWFSISSGVSDKFASELVG